MTRRRWLLGLLGLLATLMMTPPAFAFNFVPAERPAAPEISFLDGDGEEVTLADFSGRIVVLNLWATWCAPCRREMPSLENLAASFADEDLAVVALSQDRGDARDKIDAFYEEVGVDGLEVYRDPEARTARDLRAPGLPTTIIFDRSGREVGRVLGDAEWDGEEALELLRLLVEE
ncbi:MAG: TlpA family protein disulfide reductase [Solirubrobacterales bacterium]